MLPQKLFVTLPSATGPSQATDGVAVSSTTTYYSTPWGNGRCDGQSFCLFAVGTMTGTYTLWASDHPDPSLADDTQWVQDTTITFTNPAGADSKFNDSASGTGTIKGYVTQVES